MIRLSLGANTVVLTLTEKTTIANAVYLFEFVNRQTKVKYYCIATDISLYTYRYNKFTLTIKTSPNALNGELNLTIGDEYDYTVYAQTSTTNLDPDLADETVETGMMTYDKILTTRNEYAGTNTTRAVYEK